MRDFSLLAFLYRVVHDCSSKCPSSMKTSLPKKVPGYALEKTKALSFVLTIKINYFFFPGMRKVFKLRFHQKKISPL